MYEVIGFLFVPNKKDGSTMKVPIPPGTTANGWDEVYQFMKEAGIEHYLFTLNPVRSKI